MRKNIVLIAAILSMFVFSLQIAEPVAAAKLKVVDHGSTKFKDPYDKSTVTYKWKTYQMGTNYVEVVGSYYFPEYNLREYVYVYLKKVSKTKIKMSGKITVKDSHSSHSQSIGSHYYYTKLTAAQYYWRVVRPEMLSS